MKEQERGELLSCARGVASILEVLPAEVPIEGYYSEDHYLSTYFRLMRALQGVPLERAPEVEKLPQFLRLLDVTSSPIFGRPVRKHLLPTGRDPLSAALKLTALEETTWTVPSLIPLAARIAEETDDFSLVGLAARAKDPVVLAALRESVVLYAEIITGEFQSAFRRPTYVWRVDPELAAAAQTLRGRVQLAVWQQTAAANQRIRPASFGMRSTRRRSSAGAHV